MTGLRYEIALYFSPEDGVAGCGRGFFGEFTSPSSPGLSSKSSSSPSDRKLSSSKSLKNSSSVFGSYPTYAESSYIAKGLRQGCLHLFSNEVGASSERAHHPPQRQSMVVTTGGERALNFVHFGLILFRTLFCLLLLRHRDLNLERAGDTTCSLFTAGVPCAVWITTESQPSHASRGPPFSRQMVELSNGPCTFVVYSIGY